MAHIENKWNNFANEHNDIISLANEAKTYHNQLQIDLANLNSESFFTAPSLLNCYVEHHEKVLLLIMQFQALCEKYLKPELKKNLDKFPPNWVYACFDLAQPNIAIRAELLVKNIKIMSTYLRQESISYNWDNHDIFRQRQDYQRALNSLEISVGTHAASGLCESFRKNGVTPIQWNEMINIEKTHKSIENYLSLLEKFNAALTHELIYRAQNQMDPKLTVHQNLSNQLERLSEEDDSLKTCFKRCTIS